MTTYEICINLLMIITFVLAVHNEVELAKMVIQNRKSMQKFVETLIEKSDIEEDEDEGEDLDGIRVRVHPRIIVRKKDEGKEDEE